MELKQILGILIIAVLFTIVGFYLALMSITEFNNSGLQHTKLAPYPVINESQITLTDNSICIEIPNAEIGRYAATGSMKPTLDENSIGIRIKITNESQVHIGDIVSYQHENDTIIHRVIGISQDPNGIYFTMKGDNNLMSISYENKVRFKDLKYLTVGMLW